MFGTTRRSLTAVVVALLAVSVCQQAMVAEAATNPILPGPRSEPAWTAQQREAGYAIWTADCTEQFFENIPPLAGHLIPMPEDTARPNQTQPYFANSTAEQLASLPKCVTTAGEYTPLLIGIWALRDRGCIRLSAPSSRFKIKTTHVLFQNRLLPSPYTKDSRRLGIPFFLPEEEEAELQGGKNTVYWLTIQVPPKTAPGVYQEKLHLYLQEIDRVFKDPKEYRAAASDRYGRRYIEIPYTVEVLPLKLPPSKAAFGVFTVGGRRPDWALTPEYERLCAEDIAAHGHNSATTGSTMKDIQFPKTGKVKIEGSELERRIQLRMKAGLLRKDIPFFHWGSDPVEAGGVKQYCDYARQLTQAFKERGWPEPILYGPDEPGPVRMKSTNPEALIAVQKFARTGTALKGHAVTQYDIGQYFSVWMINIFSFTPEVVEQAKKEQKELWTYDCYHRGTNPVLHRYYAGLHTWAHRFKGNFLWAYTHTSTNSWETNRTDHRGMVSPSKAGPVAMVGWEARREGIYDYRLLFHLEELATKANHKAALAWLSKLRSKAVYKICADEKGHFLARYSTFWWDMTDLLNPCPAVAPSQYKEIRAQAVKYISSINGE
jgi:hypothetical protein